MIKLLTENPQIKSTVETAVVASAAANGFDLAGWIDLTLNPILQAVSLVAGICLSVIMIKQRMPDAPQSDNNSHSGCNNTPFNETDKD